MINREKTVIGHNDIVVPPPLCYSFTKPTCRIRAVPSNDNNIVCLRGHSQGAEGVYDERALVLKPSWHLSVIS